MKETNAYVRRFLVEDVIRDLREAGAPRLTAINVEGLAEEVADRFTGAIRRVACTGRRCDGPVAVSNQEGVWGMRTGERIC